MLHYITASCSSLTWMHTRPQWVNSLAPGSFKFEFRYVIFKPILVNGGWGISYEIALRWMPQDLNNDKSTLVQVMAWCRQATSHYLSQCWLRSMSPNGVTGSQWVKETQIGVLVSIWITVSRMNGNSQLLTHWGRDKMDAIFQTTFSNRFSWMQMY